MPFNGSGTFNRVYSWAQDALNGLFISSSRMDTEMNGMATGLSNCLTRDGQSPPTANIPMNGFKITGLADGTLATDAAAFGQIASAVSASTGWVTEVNAIAFVSANSFTVAGNQTGVYTPGRRLKGAITGPPTTWYGTVLSSTFSVLTTVTVLKDTYPVASANLDAGLTSMQYGVLAADYTSAPRKTLITHTDSNSATPVSNTNTQFTWGGSPLVDTLSEFSSSTFTAKTAGVYYFYLVFNYIPATTYSGQTALNGGYKLNGGAVVSTGQLVSVSNSGPVVNCTMAFSLALAATNTITFWFFPGVFSTAGAVGATAFGLRIERVS